VFCFFSSTRRHTISKRDWSSDVCSSDLALRKAVSGYLKRRFALSLDPDSEILPCAGAKEALFHLPLCASSPDRPLCWYPDPAYRSEERRVGKECRTRGATSRIKKTCATR